MDMVGCGFVKGSQVPTVQHGGTHGFSWFAWIRDFSLNFLVSLSESISQPLYCAPWPDVPWDSEYEGHRAECSRVEVDGEITWRGNNKASHW